MTDINAIISADEHQELLNKYRYDVVLDRLKNLKPLAKVELPFKRLNELLEGGLEEECLWIIGGLPGAGKTTFANQLIEHLSSGFPVASINLEMTDRKMIPKIEKRNLRNSKNLYTVFDTRTITQIEEFITAFKSVHTGQSFIVIDYLQKIEHETAQTEKEALDDIIVRLKELTKKFAGTRIILISSMNSDAFRGENRQGVFSGSRKIEYEVDIASTFVYVNEDNKIMKKLENIDEEFGKKYRRALYFVKNRQGAVHRKVVFDFNSISQTFCELGEEDNFITVEYRDNDKVELPAI